MRKRKRRPPKRQTKSSTPDPMPAPLPPARPPFHLTAPSTALDIFDPNEPDDAAWSKAMAEAIRRFGDTACVGRDLQRLDSPMHVGKKGKYGVWILFGSGKTWDEAFADVKDVSPGKLIF